jgi:IMP dehydrogenase/GMP reductase
MNRLKIAILIAALPIILFAKEQTKAKNNMEIEMLRDAGAATYMVLPDNTYIGFSKENKPVVAVNSKEFKSYSVITICVAVKKSGDNFIISDAKVKDLDKIKDKKKNDNVKSAVNDIKGKQIFSPKQKHMKIDAITGATRYHNAVYLNGNILSKELLEKLQKNPKPEKTIAVPIKESKETLEQKKVRN